MAKKDTPTTVQIDKDQLPMQVEIAPAEKQPAATLAKGSGRTLLPTTTEQQDIMAAASQVEVGKTKQGQRDINLLWETTQSWIALIVVVGGILVNAVLVLVVVVFNKEVTVTQLSLLSICLQFINLTVGIVIGFYFSRINHQAIGGTGPKPETPPYTGR